MSVLPIGIGSSIGYNIDNSVRLRAAASAHFSKTFGSAGDRKTWTFHIRLKRGTLGSYQRILSDSTNNTYLRFDTNDRLEWNYYDGTSSNSNTSTRKFRDPTGWLDIVLSCDTTQGTSTNRWKIEVNGETLSAWDAGPSYTGTLNNAGCSINNNTAHYISGYAGTAEFFDGVVADIHFIGGARLSASDFGKTNADGVWVPKPYAGSYSGTNSSHMDHADIAVTAGSNAGLGKDVSGNGNYWNTTNISVTSGVTYDSFTDTPTNNFCTLNPLANATLTSVTFKNGNLGVSTSTSRQHILASFVLGATSKFYWECSRGNASGSDYQTCGIALLNTKIDSSPSYINPNNVWGYANSGKKVTNGTASGAIYTVSSATTDVWGFEWDGPNSTLTCYLNNTSLFSITGLTGEYVPYFGIETPCDIWVNFGQRPFSYTHSGFNSLCTANLPAVAIPNPKKHFDIVTRAGTAASYSVGGLQFQPDMAWIKSRGRVIDHAIYDAVRGVEKRLESNNSDAEVTGDTTGLTAFNSDGYTGGALDQINGTTATNSFVDWMWKAGGAPSTDNVAGAGNTPTAGSVKIDGANLGSALAGSIAATRLSANTTAGFSIVTYTGTGANATVAHGLGVVPKLIFNKPRNAADNCPTYHGSMTALDYVYLNLTNASASLAAMWNSTAPSSTVFSVGTNSNINSAAQTMVSYCFAEIPGYSKFGSYVGNGSADGPFVFCGFRPRFILIKSTSASNWVIYDGAREPYNAIRRDLSPNLSASEYTDASTYLDIVASGFKLRGSRGDINGALTFIFAAFAEHPFGGGNVAPAPAR